MKSEKKPKIKVGILLDSMTIQNWQYTMISRVIADGYSEIACLVIDEKSKSENISSSLIERISGRYKNHWGQLIHNIFRRLLLNVQRAVLSKTKPQFDAFLDADILKLLPDVPIVYVAPEKKKYSDVFREKDILGVGQYEPDVLIRLGFRILRGPILDLPRYGIWSYHHGDNRINRGGPPGYWEAMENWQTTGAILQVLTEDLDAGIVLYRSQSSTIANSVHLNNSQLYWKSAFYIPRCLKILSQTDSPEEFFGKFAKENEPVSFYDRRLYRYPSNRELLLVILKKALERVKTAIRSRFYFDQWILLFDMRDGLSSSFWRFKKIIPPKTKFWADPFIVFRDNTYYVFIEEYLYASKRGHISVIRMTQDGQYDDPVQVLERDYHLSYPFVFEHDDVTYMVPETLENSSVELYRCDKFPDQWSYVMPLMEDVKAVDATLKFFENKWYMFVNVVENDGASSWDELHLFYADDFRTKDWQPHPNNPVVSDVRQARPAGRIFFYKENLYRPSQDCRKRYGYGLNINKIIKLSESEYEEETVSKAFPNWDKKMKAVHSFAHEGRLTVIDGLLRRTKSHWLP